MDAIPTAADLDAREDRPFGHQGRVQYTRLTRAEARLLVRRMADRGHQFAAGVAANLDRNPGDKTWAWAYVLGGEELDRIRFAAIRSARLAEEQAAEAAREAAATAQPVGDLTALMALLARAGEHLKQPKIRLSTPEGKPIVLALLGEKSRNPGSVSVTDGGRYGERRYYGRIAPDGRLLPAQGDMPEGLIELLRRFAADPAEVAAEYGRLLGVCCFCAIRLTDARSTAVGYGPICADHYNLPWGEIETNLVELAAQSA